MLFPISISIGADMPKNVNDESMLDESIIDPKQKASENTKSSIFSEFLNEENREREKDDNLDNTDYLSSFLNLLSAYFNTEKIIESGLTNNNTTEEKDFVNINSELPKYFLNTEKNNLGTLNIEGNNFEEINIEVSKNKKLNTDENNREILNIVNNGHDKFNPRLKSGEYVDGGIEPSVSKIRKLPTPEGAGLLQILGLISPNNLDKLEKFNFKTNFEIQNSDGKEFSPPPSLFKLLNQRDFSNNENNSLKKDLPKNDSKIELGVENFFQILENNVKFENPKIIYKKIENLLSKIYNQDLPKSELKNFLKPEQIKFLQSFILERMENKDINNTQKIYPSGLIEKNVENNQGEKIKFQNFKNDKNFVINQKLEKNLNFGEKKLEEIREITQTLLVNEQEPINKFLNEKKEENNRDEHIESLAILGNNGDSFSHDRKLNSQVFSAQTTNVDMAVNKVIDLSNHLKAVQGGIAKFQIQDSQLGKINLEVNMKDKNSLTVFIQAEHEEVKKHIEEKVDFLKQSLDSQKINLADFKVTVLDKPSSNLSNNNTNQQGNNSQNFQQNMEFQSNFQQQSNQNNNQNNNLLFNDDITSISSNSNYKNVQKNSITNIQRGANGSIKVSA